MRYTGRPAYCYAGLNCRQRGRLVRQRRFYDGHDRKVDGSSPTQTSLLRPWIKSFTTITSAWWSLTSSKLKKTQAKFKRITRKQGQLLSESGFVPCIAPPSLSHDRIKMKKLAEATETFTRKVKLLFYLFALVLPFVFVVALLAYVFVV